ncbi:MAG: gas vesicle protein K [Deltaproteobacteria bacterium]|nr:gas vesicle protein K [Deltaproteobacteria bacterium]
MQSDAASAAYPCSGESLQGGRINLNPDNVKNGLAQLVLTLVKLLHELLERQAIRRIDAGSLSDQEIEGVGVTLMRQAEELERLRKAFSLEEEDLNMDLGPLGKLL